MLIHLSDVLAAVGKRKQYEAELEMGTFPASGNRYKILSKEPMKLELFYVEERKLCVTGKIQLKVRFFCDRCLEPVVVPFDFSFEEEVEMGSTDGEGEELSEDAAFISDLQLDTALLAAEELLMRMPMKILCREDCKGICNRCGANLNQGACRCEELPKDPRMAAILDIFKESTTK